MTVHVVMWFILALQILSWLFYFAAGWEFHKYMQRSAETAPPTPNDKWWKMPLSEQETA